MGQGCCRTASVYPARDAQYVRKDSLTSFGNAGSGGEAAAAASEGGLRHDSVGLSLAKQADAAPMVLLTPPHTLQQQAQQQQQQQQQQQPQRRQYPPLPVQKPAEQASEKKREPGERLAEAPPLLPPLPPASVPPVVRKDSGVHLANASSISSSYVSTAKQSSRSSAAASKHTDDQAAAAAAAGNNGQPTTTTSNTRSPQVQTIGGRLYNEEQEIPKTVSIYHQTNVPSEMDTMSKHSEELPRPISFTGVSQVNRAPSWSLADTAHAVDRAPLPPASPPPPPPPPQSVEEPSLGTVRTVPQDSSAIGNDSAEAMMAEYPPVPTQPSSSASGSGGHASPPSGPNQTIASVSVNTVLGTTVAPPAEAPAAAEPPTPTPTAPPASALLSDPAVPGSGSGSGTVICNRVTESVDQKGRRRVNGYTLTKHLGSGRYGDVYLVEAGEKNNKRLYALKEVSRKLFGGGGGKAGGGGEAKNKGKDGSTLSKEVLVLMLINHPNVVKLIEVLDDESMKQQYLVLEYVDGGPIMTLNEKGVAAESPFPEDVTRNYFQQTVEGLAYLHNHNIIHKDIKPENLLVTRDRTTVKLADFGVSRLMASEDDGSRDTSGTPLFLSPETCRGDFSSGKSNDIWALGVTLYIFMYGRTPFAAAKTEILLYQRIQDDEILYPSKPRYSRDLRALIRRLLERNVLLRITLNEIRNNAWVRGSCELLPEEEIEQIQSCKAQSAAGPGATGARGGAERRTVTPFHMVDSRTDTGKENDINILIVEDVFLVKKLTERSMHTHMSTNSCLRLCGPFPGDPKQASKQTKTQEASHICTQPTQALGARAKIPIPTD